MAGGSKISIWKRVAVGLLQAGLGLFLIVVSISVAINMIALRVLGDGRNYEPDAWLGFWGNVFGGSLGLIGGLIAAYAAVRAVERQLEKQEVDRKVEAKKQLTAYARFFLISVNASIISARSLTQAIKNNDIRQAIKYGGNVFLPQRWIDPQMRAEWQSKAPTVAIQLTLFIAMLEQQKMAMEAARNFADSGAVKLVDSDRPTAGQIRQIASTNSLLIGHGATLCMTMSQELDELSAELRDSAIELSALFKDLSEQSDRLYENYLRLGGNPDSTKI